jgi:Zn-dependent protease with chaperone function
MLTLRYSREHEREADAYAIEIMQRNRLPPSALADVLIALENQNRGAQKNEPASRAKAEEPALDDFLSTHPHTRERIEALRAAGA